MVVTSLARYPQVSNGPTLTRWWVYRLVSRYTSLQFTKNIPEVIKKCPAIIDVVTSKAGTCKVTVFGLLSAYLCHTL